MEIVLISIGNELLNGTVVNTNATWIAQKLYEVGFTVKRVLTISDSKEDIHRELENNEGVVLITGGLGPTNDDITKACLMEHTSSSLILHEPTWQHVRSIFEKRGVDPGERNKQQAMVPSDAIVLPNEMGTAPGLYIKGKNNHIIALPGVPFEMKHLMQKEVIPLLLKEFKPLKLKMETVHIIGVSESHLQEQVAHWEAQLPDNIQVAFLPEPGVVKLRLSGFVNGVNDVDQIIKDALDELHLILGDSIFGYNGEQMEEIVGEELKRQGKTLSVAESCTGGYLSHLLTSIPGSSEYFKGGFIAYSNEFKIDKLEVEPYIIEKYGAVSIETVEAMAKASLEKTNTDYSIAISGIAGPDGGTQEKPVGTVCIAVFNGDEMKSYQYQFSSNRMVNIRRAAIMSLNLLRLMVQ